MVQFVRIVSRAPCPQNPEPSNNNNREPQPRPITPPGEVASDGGWGNYQQCLQKLQPNFFRFGAFLSRLTS